jgi:hypothetical protein
MMRVGALLMVAALVGVTIVPETTAGKRKPRLGVFGTIHGKKFKATNLGGAADPCVNGIYRPSDGILVFAAVECRPKRRRQGAVRRNYKVLAMACTNFDPSVNTLAPPYEIPCPSSGYTETKTGRFGQLISMTEWGSNFELTDNLVVTSNLHMRIDAFDGTNVRGAIFGVFEVPLQGATAATPAQITGEVQFEFPFKIQ